MCSHTDGWSCRSDFQRSVLPRDFPTVLRLLCPVLRLWDLLWQSLAATLFPHRAGVLWQCSLPLGAVH